MIKRAQHSATGVGATFEEAMRLHREGRSLQADALCGEVLRAAPKHFHALHLRGLIALERGELEVGLEYIGRSLNIAPSQPPALSNAGNALLKAGRSMEALDYFERALELKPDYVVALYNRGNTLLTMLRFEEALASYARVLQIKPDHVLALHHRTRILVTLERHAAALASADEALRMSGGTPELHHDRGDALVGLHRRDEAIDAYGAALRLDPKSMATWLNRGNARQASGRTLEALADYDRALELEPSSCAALVNRGQVLLKMRRAAESLDSFDAALGINASAPEALIGRAQALEMLCRYSAAAMALAGLLEQRPDYPYALGNLMQMRLEAADWSEWPERLHSLDAGIARREKVVNPFTWLALTASAEAQLRCARIFATDSRVSLPALSAGYGHDRLRVAYVSADFREHALAYLMAGIIERHDRARFEILGVSLAASDPNVMSERLRAGFDRFIDLSSLDDLEIARHLRALEVDVAVDLMGYTQNGRPGIFAARAAPVQVNYLGYPGTMGATFMDYLIADDFVIPPARRECYSEQVVYLPQCFQANDDRRPAPPASSRSEAGLPPGGIVFCCFNNSHKINGAMFDIWCRVLDNTPGSVLWLVDAGPEWRANLAREARARHIAPERLIFAAQLPYAQHLARLALADLFLDTLPFNAGATASDALWAGVPVITCAGDAFASRMAGSLLRSVGLQELVTHDLAAYANLAITLAADAPRLAALRGMLAANRALAALFDTPMQCRHLEAAYRHMVAVVERGAAPHAFSVGSSGSPSF